MYVAYLVEAYLGVLRRTMWMFLSVMLTMSTKIDDDDDDDDDK